MQAILANYADIIYSDGKNLRIRHVQNGFSDNMMVSSLDQIHAGDVIETRSAADSVVTASTTTDQGTTEKTNSNSESFWQRWFSIPLSWLWGSE